jgi:hypothetical protein
MRAWTRDPCAPLAFALVLHKLLKRVGTLSLETNLNAWYQPG